MQSDDTRWTLLIVVPKELPEDFFRRVQQAALVKAPMAALTRLMTMKEGRAVQVLHLGPYSSEDPTIARLEAFARDAGLTYVGRHHEIYLGDPRRAAPEKLRTIIRHAVQ